MKSARTATRSVGVLLLALAACRDARLTPTDTTAPTPSPTTSVAAAPPSAHRSVKPSATDPAITEPDDDHEVFVPAAAGNGKLLVFLPGTNGLPSTVTMFLQTAAQAGYLTIGLDYPDSEAATICGRDLACFGEFRQEVFDGTDASPKIDVAPVNSIKHRLVALLRYLDAQSPTEGWGAFVSGDDVVYPKIAFAGHSQGGGHAAFIAKGHEVARVLMFSSVCDAASGDPPTAATWVSEPHLTPVERYYGFDHTHDEFARKIAVTWPALGLDRLGPRTSVDGVSPPYGGSHELTTSVAEPSPKRAHTCVVGDGSTPMNGGAPLFADVWRYMLRAGEREL